MNIQESDFGALANAHGRAKERHLQAVRELCDAQAKFKLAQLEETMALDATETLAQELRRRGVTNV